MKIFKIKSTILHMNMYVKKYKPLSTVKHIAIPVFYSSFAKWLNKKKKKKKKKNTFRKDTNSFQKKITYCTLKWINIKMNF